MITISVFGYYRQLDGRTKENKDKLDLRQQKWIMIDVMLKVCGLFSRTLSLSRENAKAILSGC